MANKYDQWLSSQMRPTQPVKQSSGFNFLPILINLTLVGVVAWLLFNRSSGPTPGPEPVPVLNVVELAETSSRKYAENLSMVANKTADGVASGQLKSRADILEFSKQYALPARTNAFAPIDQADNLYIPADEWDAAAKRAVESYLRDIAKGHMRAAK